RSHREESDVMSKKHDKPQDAVDGNAQLEKTTEKDKKKAKSGKYEDVLRALQVELNLSMLALQQGGERVLVLFECRDTAGKGGAIRAVSERLTPRQCHTAALGVPSEREKSQWYFQRYVPYLPAAGEMVLFDRSWYNRAGVEAVMGYCTPEQTA